MPDRSLGSNGPTLKKDQLIACPMARGEEIRLSDPNADRWPELQQVYAIDGNVNRLFVFFEVKDEKDTKERTRVRASRISIDNEGKWHVFPPDWHNLDLSGLHKLKIKDSGEGKATGGLPGMATVRSLIRSVLGRLRGK